MTEKAEGSGESRAWRVGGRAVLLVFGSVVGLGLGEFVARVGGTSKTWTSYIASSEWVSRELVTEGVGFRRRPEKHPIQVGGVEIAVNDSGFRDRPFGSDNPPAGTVRVLYLGDFVTEGYGLITDDRYSEIITDSLRVDVSIGAFNMAVAGQATVDQHVILKEWGRRVDPKVVLLQMGVNDFPRNALFFRSATVVATVTSRSECSLLMSVSGSADTDEKPCSVQSWLQRRSALYLTVAERWHELRLRNGVTNSALASILKVDENAWESTEEVLVKDPAQGLFIERQLEGLVQRVSSTSGVEVKFVAATR